MPTRSAASRLPLIFTASLTLAACSDGSALPTATLLSDTVSVDGVFRETAAVTPSPLRAAVDVTLLVMNQGARPETLFSSPRGSCDGGLIIRAWHASKGKTTLAWLSATESVAPCPGHALPLVIAPHASVSLGREIGSAELLGDSLPSDSYIFTVSADLQSPMLRAQVSAGPIFIGLKYIVPPGTVLDGTWAGAADGILLELPLRWTADSVNGTGTYVAMPPYANRCGGATLRGSGTVTFAAARVEDRLIGRMAFDNGWTPPYSAVQTGRDLLDGQFMSVDAGPCRLSLARQIPAAP